MERNIYYYELELVGERGDKASRSISGVNMALVNGEKDVFAFVPGVKALVVSVKP